MQAMRLQNIRRSMSPIHHNVVTDKDCSEYPFVDLGSPFQSNLNVDDDNHGIADVSSIQETSYHVGEFRHSLQRMHGHDLPETKISIVNDVKIQVSAIFHLH
jgi:hypothetical protein